ncbi:MAG: hypothetical protein A2007_01625 [Verrucomicrobia bacterium GWC2_42_7]|nr:MAG: hypothetical protein A2007_01625 [Verrucomicrobia bacterium GWC2_42_7]
MRQLGILRLLENRTEVFGSLQFLFLAMNWGFSLFTIAQSKSGDFGWAIISFSLEGSGNLSFLLKRKGSGFLLKKKIVARM